MTIAAHGHDVVETAPERTAASVGCCQRGSDSESLLSDKRGTVMVTVASKCT
jgi:hypothetical protein